MVFRLFQHKLFGGRKNDRLDGVFTASELERLFELERARVDRNGQVFSTVVFVPDGDRFKDLDALVDVVREHVRNYDVIGQLDAGRLAVLLPDTPSEGGWAFADKNLARIAESGLKFNCEVYSYPADWSSPEVEDETEAVRPTPVPLSLVSDEEDQEEEVAPRATGTDDVMMSEDRPGLAHIRAQAGERSVRDLEPFFHREVSIPRRIIDVVVSGTAIALLSPVLIVTAAAVKMTSPGPIIFRQRRAGRGGTPFTFYKFRSMYVDAEERKKALAHLNEKRGPIFKMKNDPRMTPVGRFIRRASIDELPQLFNVLKGDMTLIGPRPPTLNEVDRYERWQRRRLDITGGLTCIWQVSGRSEVGFQDWVRMDLEYQRKRSFAFDVKLLFRTIGAVLSGRGAY
ncbi:MAG: hypothetical protein GY711_26285 [bacterium]|nr:hypothetical protein [bacterium]